MVLKDIPRSLWLWLPLPFFVATEGLGALAKNYYPIQSSPWWEHRRLYGRWFHGEFGLVEIVTAIVLAVAIVLGIVAVRRAFATGWRWIGWWLVAVLAATVYFWGEEISWGQHYIGWETPQWFMDLTGNVQGETNIHNISPIFNQKPRQLFFLWVMVGGIGVPIWRRRKGIEWAPATSLYYWFWPTSVCTFIAVLATISPVPEIVVEVLRIPEDDTIRWRLMPTNGSELQEYCFAMFLLIYFASAIRRFGQLARIIHDDRMI